MLLDPIFCRLICHNMQVQVINGIPLQTDLDVSTLGSWILPTKANKGSVSLRGLANGHAPTLNQSATVFLLWRGLGGDVARGVSPATHMR